MSAALSPQIRDECEEIALEARYDLGVGAADRLDPEALAKHLAIPTKSLHLYSGELPAAVAHLTEERPSVFSALTVYRGSRRQIVYNPVHSPRRHANTISHELAHILLEHEPGPLFDAAGKRIWAARDEAEADYLAGALLVPASAVALVLERVEGNLLDAADHFGVSERLMGQRMEAAENIQLERRRLEVVETPPAHEKIGAGLLARISRPQNTEALPSAPPAG